jgi:hypothetical protein
MTMEGIKLISLERELASSKGQFTSFLKVRKCPLQRKTKSSAWNFYFPESRMLSPTAAETKRGPKNEAAKKGNNFLKQDGGVREQVDSRKLVCYTHRSQATEIPVPCVTLCQNNCPCFSERSFPRSSRKGRLLSPLRRRHRSPLRFLLTMRICSRKATHNIRLLIFAAISKSLGCS